MSNPQPPRTRKQGNKFNTCTPETTTKPTPLHRKSTNYDAATHRPSNCECVYQRQKTDGLLSSLSPPPPSPTLPRTERKTAKKQAAHGPFAASRHTKTYAVQTRLLSFVLFASTHHTVGTPSSPLLPEWTRFERDRRRGGCNRSWDQQTMYRYRLRRGLGDVVQPNIPPFQNLQPRLEFPQTSMSQALTPRTHLSGISTEVNSPPSLVTDEILRRARVPSWSARHCRQHLGLNFRTPAALKMPSPW